jgi:hypothetical protein
MPLLLHIPRWTTPRRFPVAFTNDVSVYPAANHSVARPAIPSGPGKAPRAPTINHVVTCGASFRGTLLRRRPFLLECLPLEAPVKRQEHSSLQRKELITMTAGLAFINQYLANTPHMRNYLATLCPALNNVEAKNESEATIQKEKSHA